jgi:SOS response associated peptidase (SRAP)
VKKTAKLFSLRKVQKQDNSCGFFARIENNRALLLDERKLRQIIGKEIGCEWIRTLTVITTDANALVADIHDRMPQILAVPAGTSKASVRLALRRPGCGRPSELHQPSRQVRHASARSLVRRALTRR